MQLTPVHYIVLEIAGGNRDVLWLLTLQDAHTIIPQDLSHLAQIRYASSHHSRAHDGGKRSVDRPVCRIGDSRQNACGDKLLTRGVSYEIEEHDDAVRLHVRQPRSQF